MFEGFIYLLFSIFYFLFAIYYFSLYRMSFVPHVEIKKIKQYK